MKASEIRARFLEYFADHNHTVVRSSTLVPQDDPTLLFTNAGMNQFKSVFLGLEKRDYVRATSVQKCMRVSGKHNDLEEVGRDARHHTFFEMLGNWSFGDYYKRESLRWGCDFLIREMGLDPDRLWYSVYKDDDEAYGIFRDELGIRAERIVRLGDIEKGDEENFWSMADTGPCGPCAEIHIDQGEHMKCDHPKGCALGVCDCDRWLELWNHVFMEFDRDETGRLNPLPMKSVDTGLGFERLVAVMQGVESNYATDIFRPLIARMAELCGRRAEGEDLVGMQVIADHARAVTFTIADGARPSNEGRGYVVRRILRRAARHGHLLGLEEPFLWRVAETVIDTMGEAYPELAEHRERILPLIRQEEERFLRTLASGLQVYAEYRDLMRREKRTELRGDEAFKLHDTFGFPVDLTAVVAAEDGFTVDSAGFSVCMEAQRRQSRSEKKYMAGVGPWQVVAETTDLAGYRAVFTGYDRIEGRTRVVAVRAGGEDEKGGPLSHLLLAETPFYAESGGQVGDTGFIEAADGTLLEVLTTVGIEEGAACVVAGGPEDLVTRFSASAEVQARVDRQRREAIMRHHTATHLLHAALRRQLGEHVEQAGSVVSPERLRFDFRHDGALKADEIARVEATVAATVLANRPVQNHDEVPLAEARERGAMALFGEKYGDVVRMIEIPGADEGGPVESLELCGGTHCPRTGDVGPVVITSEGSVAAGVRRIEAVAGRPAQALIAARLEELAATTALLRADGGPAAAQVGEILAERDDLRRQLAALQQESARASLDDALGTPVMIAGLPVIVARVEAEDRGALMQLGDHVRDRLGSGVVVLAAMLQGKATLIVTVTADLIDAGRLHAGKLVKDIGARAGGRGGGKPNMAQAGLPDEAAIGLALETATEVVAEHLA